VGLISCEHNLKNVLLPLPEGPTTDTKSIGMISKDKFFSMYLLSLMYDTFLNSNKDINKSPQIYKIYFYFILLALKSD
jgi:hypothetical protein